MNISKAYEIGYEFTKNQLKNGMLKFKITYSWKTKF